MLEKMAAFGLAFVASAALANPLGGAVAGLSGALKGATSTATGGAIKLPALPVGTANAKGAPRLAVPASGLALPGLGGASDAPGPLGVTLLQEGADGSGYDYVLNSDQLQPLADALSPLTNNVVSQTVLNGLTTALFGEEAVTQGTLFDSDHFIDDGLDNNLITPLLGLDGDGGMIDVALFDGNGTANAGPDGLLGAAVGSGSFTGNGGAIALGVLNDGFSGNGGQIGIGVLNDGPVSGNGGQIGIGVLSGEASGNGGALGVGVLNKNDLLHICGGGTCGSANDLISQGGAFPQTELLPGVVIGGGRDAVPSGTSNPLLNVGALTGNGVANGGLIGVGVLAGDDSAQADLLGACVLCGNNTAKGSVAAAALSGNNSGAGGFTDASTLPLGIGVGALNNNNSGNGTDLGVGALSGNNSGNGGALGVGAINSGNSGNGGFIGAGIISGANSGNGDVIGAGVINAGNNSNPGNGGGNNAGGNNGSGNGTVGIGVISDSGNGGGNNGGNNNVADNANENVPDGNDEGFCALEVRDAKGRVVQTIKRPCKQLSKVKRRAA